MWSKMKDNSLFLADTFSTLTEATAVMCLGVMTVSLFSCALLLAALANLLKASTRLRNTYRVNIVRN